jgi:hypothetical protein
VRAVAEDRLEAADRPPGQARDDARARVAARVDREREPGGIAITPGAAGASVERAARVDPDARDPLGARAIERRGRQRAALEGHRVPRRSGDPPAGDRRGAADGRRRAEVLRAERPALGVEDAQPIGERGPAQRGQEEVHAAGEAALVGAGAGRDGLAPAGREDLDARHVRRCHAVEHAADLVAEVPRDVGRRRA